MSKRKPRSRPRPTTAEPPTIEILIVAWMLAVMTTLVCELAFVAARGYLLLVDGEAMRIQVLAGVLLFAALVVGLVSLLLEVAVIRSRRPVPPPGIIVFAAVVGAAPLVTMVLRLLS